VKIDLEAELFQLMVEDGKKIATEILGTAQSTFDSAAMKKIGSQILAETNYNPLQFRIEGVSTEDSFFFGCHTAKRMSEWIEGDE
jgi:hypothetical protein